MSSSRGPRECASCSSCWSRAEVRFSDFLKTTVLISAAAATALAAVGWVVAGRAGRAGRPRPSGAPAEGGRVDPRFSRPLPPPWKPLQLLPPPGSRSNRQEQKGAGGGGRGPQTRKPAYTPH